MTFLVTFFNCKFDFITAEIVISYTLKYALHLVHITFLNIA